MATQRLPASSFCNRPIVVRMPPADPPTNNASSRAARRQPITQSRSVTRSMRSNVCPAANFGSLPAPDRGSFAVQPNRRTTRYRSNRRRSLERHGLDRAGNHDILERFRCCWSQPATHQTHHDNHRRLRRWSLHSANADCLGWRLVRPVTVGDRFKQSTDSGDPSGEKSPSSGFSTSSICPPSASMICKFCLCAPRINDTDEA